MEVKIVKIVLSLGSNLGDRIHYIQTAYNYISEEIGTIEKKSSFHANDPQGYESKNEFINSCIKVSTKLRPKEVLVRIQSIEEKMGRLKTKTSYEDRVIDIDIIFYGKLICNEPVLKIPHPRYHERNFVLLLLKELGETKDPRPGFITNN